MVDAAARMRRPRECARAKAREKEIAPSFAMCIFVIANGASPDAIRNKDRFCAHQQMRPAMYCPQGTNWPHRLQVMEPTMSAGAFKLVEEKEVPAAQGR